MLFIQQKRNFAGFRPIVALVLAPLALAGLAGCNGGNKADADAKAKAQLAKNSIVQVSVTPAKRETISDTIDVTGSLTSPNDVTVGVKSAGRILNVYYREGDAVTYRAKVAEQDPVDLKNQLAQQEAARESQRALVGQQKASLATAYTRLTQAKAALDNSRTNLRLTREQTDSAVKQAQAALVAAQEQGKIVKEGARPQERQQAEENLASAKADRDKARSDLKRYQDLYRQQAISAQQLDQAQSARESADARYNNVAAALNLIQEGNRPEDIRRAQAAVEQANQTVIAAQSNRNQIALRQADVENAQAGVNAAVAGIAQVKAAIQQAQATLQQAEATVRLAKQAISDAAIVSPIDGIVQERKVEPGAQVGIANPEVMRIVSLKDLYFDAIISESQYSRVQTGQAVAVSVNALTGRTFKGRVKNIFPVASAARSFTVRVVLTNDDRSLRPQMFATGRITLETHPNATHSMPIVVLRDAVLEPNGTAGRVMVVTDGVAKSHNVKTGILSGARIEILSGLKDGDKVITTGQGQLQDGDKVNTDKPAEEKQASAAP